MSSEQTKDKRMTLIEHLEELRHRIIVVVGSLVVAFPIAFAYRATAMRWLIYPGQALAEEGKFQLIQLTPGEAFFTDLRISLIAAAILASPIILYQLLAFVLPALKGNEKRIIATVLPAGLLLFAAGLAFAHLVVLPPALRFLLSYGSGFVMADLSVARYTSFIISFLIPFGIMFEMPLLVWVLARVNIVTAAFLRHYRRAAILVIFILAGFLTPTVDITTQVLMAGPLLVLYEISVLIAQFVAPRK